MNITTTTVADINRHHDLARSKAAEAITHAMEAGKLLLVAKGSMEHGSWAAWLRDNVRVSTRQAQRYMTTGDTASANAVQPAVIDPPAAHEVASMQPSLI